MSIRPPAEVSTLRLLIREESKFAYRIRDVISAHLQRQRDPTIISGVFQDTPLASAERTSLAERDLRYHHQRREILLDVSTEPDTSSEISADTDSTRTAPFRNTYQSRSGSRKVTDLEAIYPTSEASQDLESLPFDYRKLIEVRNGKARISTRELRPITNRWGIAFKMRKADMIDKLILEYERRYQNEVKRTKAEMEVERIEAIRRGRKKRGRPRKVR